MNKNNAVIGIVFGLSSIKLLFMLMSRLFCLWLLCCSFAYNPIDSEVSQYIDNYRELAVVEMYRTGVPASIKLAQGILESQHGTSKLAVEANNHFGIKCKREWTGESFYHKDDDKDSRGRLIKSCFRSYDSPLDSYADHSNFLRQRPHYQILFSYDRNDYRKWAYGLKACGYATDPKYAEKLIEKIELYNLSQYDQWENPLKSLK